MAISTGHVVPPVKGQTRQARRGNTCWGPVSKQERDCPRISRRRPNGIERRWTRAWSMPWPISAGSWPGVESPEIPARVRDWSTTRPNGAALSLNCFTRACSRIRRGPRKSRFGGLSVQQRAETIRQPWNWPTSSAVAIQRLPRCGGGEGTACAKDALPRLIPPPAPQRSARTWLPITTAHGAFFLGRKWARRRKPFRWSRRRPTRATRKPKHNWASCT